MSRTILVSIRYAGAEMPCCIGPAADDTLAKVRSIALYSLGIREKAGRGLRFFAGTVELVDDTVTVGNLAGGENVLYLDLGAEPNTAPRDPRLELTPHQIEWIMRLEANAAEMREQMQRVGVDLSIAQLTGELDASATTTTNEGNVAVVEQNYNLDEAKEAAARAALRQLPDGAGNEAFLAAYNDQLRKN